MSSPERCVWVTRPIIFGNLAILNTPTEGYPRPSPCSAPPSVRCPDPRCASTTASSSASASSSPMLSAEGRCWWCCCIRPARESPDSSDVAQCGRDSSRWPACTATSRAFSGSASRGWKRARVPCRSRCSSRRGWGTRGWWCRSPRPSMSASAIGSAHDECRASWATGRTTATSVWGGASHELPSKRSSNSKRPSTTYRLERRCRDHVHRDRRISWLEARDINGRCAFPLAAVGMGKRWVGWWERWSLAAVVGCKRAAVLAASADGCCKVHIDGCSNFSCACIDVDDGDWTDADGDDGWTSQEFQLTSDATHPFYDYLCAGNSSLIKVSFLLESLNWF